MIIVQCLFSSQKKSEKKVKKIKNAVFHNTALKK